MIMILCIMVNGCNRKCKNVIKKKKKNDSMDLKTLPTHEVIL